MGVYPRGNPIRLMVVHAHCCLVKREVHHRSIFCQRDTGSSLRAGGGVAIKGGELGGGACVTAGGVSSDSSGIEKDIMGIP